MTNRYFLCLVLLLIASLGKSQQNTLTEEDSPKEKVIYQLGLNGTALLQNIISFDNELNLFLVAANIGKEKIKLRTAFNFQHQKEKIDNDVGNDNQSESTTYGARVGVEFQLKTWKKLNFYSGLDLFGYYKDASAYDISHIDIVNKFEKAAKYGLGPVAGLKLNITERFHIFTETSFYLYKFNNESGREFLENPAFDSIVEERGISYDVNPPFSVFLTFQF